MCPPMYSCFCPHIKLLSNSITQTYKYTYTYTYTYHTYVHMPYTYVHMLHTILNLLPLRIPPLVESNNKLAVSNHDQYIVLNDYFASVFTTDDGLLPVFPPLYPVGESLSSVLFSFDKVFKALKSLPSKCSATPDGFPVQSLALLLLIC